MFTKKENFKKSNEENHGQSCCTTKDSSCEKSPSKAGENETSTRMRTEAHPQSTPQSESTSWTRGKSNSGRIVIKYDVGFGNTLYIRGHGANLSWDRGIPLKNVKGDEWVWETNATFTKCEFKIILNDTCYESGPNHLLTYGSDVNYTPHFPQ